MDERIKAIFQCVVEGDNAGVQENVNAALAAGIDPGTILNEGLIAGMAEVGRLFEEGEYFVPEMLISARAMKSAMAILKPHLTSEQVGSPARSVIGTVKGDLHDIGKNLVSLMLEGAGFQVVDLGSDVSAGEVRRGGQDQRRGHCRHVGAADHHDGQHESHHHRAGRSRPARQGEGDDRRRAGDGCVRQTDRRGRLCPGCQPGRGGRQNAAGLIVNLILPK